MANAAQVASFIERIAPCAQSAYKEIGKVLPSVCIGMACTECDYGTAGSTKHHSYIGQKVGTGKTATKYWSGGFFNSKTKEEYQIGVHTVITDAFRSYDSMQQCVNNYYELLNTKFYSRVQAGVDYKTQMQQIKACGYMTSSTEVNTVIRIIETYGLTKYDTVKAPAEIINRNPYAEPTKTLRFGNKGNDVRWLQVELNKYGYGLVVDGHWGDKTQAAVLHFQAKRGLLCDALVGPKTRAALKN